MRNAFRALNIQYSNIQWSSERWWAKIYGKLKSQQNFRTNLDNVTTYDTVSPTEPSEVTETMTIRRPAPIVTIKSDSAKISACLAVYFIFIFRSIRRGSAPINLSRALTIDGCNRTIGCWNRHNLPEMVSGTCQETTPTTLLPVLIVQVRHADGDVEPERSRINPVCCTSAS